MSRKESRNMIMGLIVVASFIVGGAVMFGVSEFYRKRVEDALKWRAVEACRHQRRLPPIQCEQSEEDADVYVPRKDRRLFNVFEEEDMERMQRGERVTKVYRGGEQR